MKGCEITNWVMVVFDGSCYDADVIGQSLVQACNKYGMLGGYNSPLNLDIADFLGKTTILFGIDISHGPPGDVDSPPIAEVVASKDWPNNVSGLYSARVRTQTSEMKMIGGLYEEVDWRHGGMVKFARSTTAVAVAAPAAYVRLVALRFCKLLDTKAGSDTTSPKRSRSGSSIAEGKPMQTIPALKLKPHESMFFCRQM
ncbi:unnamed protein product [Sphagnum balticum]